jgi:hypothetical protein
VICPTAQGKFLIFSSQIRESGNLCEAINSSNDFNIDLVLIAGCREAFRREMATRYALPCSHHLSQHRRHEAAVLDQGFVVVEYTSDISSNSSTGSLFTPAADWSSCNDGMPAA